jgi:hypothetical protein
MRQTRSGVTQSVSAPLSSDANAEPSHHRPRDMNHHTMKKGIDK